jgi:CRP-like cAMP-binding protein
MVKPVSQSPNFDDIASFTVSGAAGEFVYHEGETGKDMYIIQEGQIELLNQDSGPKRQLDLLEPGDFFGELSLLEDQRRDASARAVTAYRLLRIDRTTLHQLVRENPDIAVRMLHRLASRLRAHEEARLRALEIAAGAMGPLPSRDMAAKAPASVVMPVGAGASQAPAESAAADKNAPRVAMLVHVATGRQFPCPENGELIVGRIDRATGFTPGVDLTSLDADRTLSRRHATIAARDGAIYLCESTATRNGTFVNGSRIATGVEVKLNDGDKVMFGLVETQFQHR